MTDSSTAAFRTAVRTNVDRERRMEAIRELIEMGATDVLATVVRTDGLRGTFRRQALDGIGRCGDEHALDTIAADRSLDPVLRNRADELR
jgi:hypothetical protein